MRIDRISDTISPCLCSNTPALAADESSKRSSRRTGPRRVLACDGAELKKLLSSPGMVGTAGRKDTEAIPACRAQGGQCGCSHSSVN